MWLFVGSFICCVIADSKGYISYKASLHGASTSSEKNFIFFYLSTDFNCSFSLILQLNFAYFPSSWRSFKSIFHRKMANLMQWFRIRPKQRAFERTTTIWNIKYYQQIISESSNIYVLYIIRNRRFWRFIICNLAFKLTKLQFYETGNIMYSVWNFAVWNHIYLHMRQKCNGVKFRVKNFIRN